MIDPSGDRSGVDRARAANAGPGGDRNRAAGPEQLGPLLADGPAVRPDRFWTEDGGIDGRTPVDLEALDLIPIEPLPSWVWYRDMADFTEALRMCAPAAAWPGRSRARARSAGSRTACTRTTRTCCRPGTPFSRFGPSGARFSGWSTTSSAPSTTVPMTARLIMVKASRAGNRQGAHPQTVAPEAAALSPSAHICRGAGAGTTTAEARCRTQRIRLSRGRLPACIGDSGRSPVLGPARWAAGDPATGQTGETARRASGTTSRIHHFARCDCSGPECTVSRDVRPGRQALRQRGMPGMALEDEINRRGRPGTVCRTTAGRRTAGTGLSR